MVVRTWLTRACTLGHTNGTCRASPSHASAPSSRDSFRSDQPRDVPSMLSTDQQCDCPAVWVCLLLPMRIRGSRGARPLSGDATPGADVAAAQGAGVGEAREEVAVCGKDGMSGTISHTFVVFGYFMAIGYHRSAKSRHSRAQRKSNRGSAVTNVRGPDHRARRAPGLHPPLMCWESTIYS